MVELQILQLNVRKQKEVQLSLLNDSELREYGLLCVAEPHAWPNEKEELVIVPIHHTNWERVLPSKRAEGRWQIRSMIWIREDLEAEQIPVESSDLTAVLLRLPSKRVLIISVYVECNDPEALNKAMDLIKETVNEVRSKEGSVEIVLAGDFNRHDTLWGGDDVAAYRQGEAEPILLLMEELGLSSLLPRGTKTWQNGERETTIDLMLASEALTERYQHCRIHHVEHGSDHRAIDTRFDVGTPERVFIPKPLFKSAPWEKIRERVQEQLNQTRRPTDTQEQADRLLNAVNKAVQELVPVSKPAPYAKKWWNRDLTELRQKYTTLRNQARAIRRGGSRCSLTEEQAKKAQKEYHTVIKAQKKAHWEDFLADEPNIWSAARYVRENSQSAFSKIPALKRANGTMTSCKNDQAEELLQTFFPPLPQRIEEEGIREQRVTLPFAPLQKHEIESKILSANQWKAPGTDGLPAAVWRYLWTTVDEDITALFQSSVSSGYLPEQWRHAKIIPLRKPDKPDYAVAKAWRPISLLSTLGKTLEAVIAERLSFLAEHHSLLPQNHYGARRRRSAEQALLLLQDRIYNAWRSHRVLSLVSFDVKGAYNGVYKERLTQRLRARGVPEAITKWTLAFCSNRTASITVNGQESEKMELGNPGLPQGSPLSPILFLFYNADLVQRPINNRGGAVAFVDDYTAWVEGPSAAQNMTALEKIVEEALQWERRSGATFEGDKTALIHFTRTDRRSTEVPLNVKDQLVNPSKHIKLLGVIFDAELRFREHVARAVNRGLRAALALSRLRALLPDTTRRLFTAMVAPVVDYGSAVWGHAPAASASAFNMIQKIGAKAVIGAFKSVAREVAEAEASLIPTKQRHTRRAATIWIDMLTLPASNPLQTRRVKETRRFKTPLLTLKQAANNAQTDQLETIYPYAIAPWQERIELKTDAGAEGQGAQFNEALGSCRAVIVLTAAEKDGFTVFGASIWRDEIQLLTITGVKGVSREQSQCGAELTAAAEALEKLAEKAAELPCLWRSEIGITTRNRTVLKTLNRPERQSGQQQLTRMYAACEKLYRFGVRVTAIQASTDRKAARIERALKKTIRERIQTTPGVAKTEVAKSVLLSTVRRQLNQRQAISNKVGRAIKNIDTALPGKHTRGLYQLLSKTDANALAQMRTGANRLNSYLFRIGVSESALCACGCAPETVKHFLFTCTRWNTERKRFFDKWPRKLGNVSFFLGGRAVEEKEEQGWQPTWAAVRAAVGYARATARLDWVPEKGRG